MTVFGEYLLNLPFLNPGMVARPQVDGRGRLIVSSGDNNAAGVLTVVTVELDTQGEIVPVHKGVTNTYDPSGNLQTQTVKNGSTWIRTLTYTNGEVASDSGWVRQ